MVKSKVYNGTIDNLILFGLYKYDKKYLSYEILSISYKKQILRDIILNNMINPNPYPNSDDNNLEYSNDSEYIDVKKYSYIIQPVKIYEFEQKHILNIFDIFSKKNILNYIKINNHHHDLKITELDYYCLEQIQNNMISQNILIVNKKKYSSTYILKFINKYNFYKILSSHSIVLDTYYPKSVYYNFY